MSKLPYGRQTIDQDDIDAVVEVLRSDFLTTGPEAERFEQALCDTVGSKHAVVVSSGTAALHLMALALEIPAGDVVIIPSVTFAACASTFRLAGAEIHFADVDPNTGLMRPEDLTAAFSTSPNSVRAVLNVHLNGNMADVEGLAAICHHHGVPLVEDTCHALGGSYNDSQGEIHRVGSGSHTLANIFSFHPVKTITMGEGGAITCSDEKLAAKLRLLRNHGLTRDPDLFQMASTPDGVEPNQAPWYYEVLVPGLNYRATDMQCALGRSQLKKLSGFVDKRRDLVECYHQLLSQSGDLPRVLDFVECIAGRRPAWHLLVAMINFEQTKMSRGELMQALKQDGIGTQVHYIPLHHQPYFRQRYGSANLPGADAYYRRCLSLPLFPTMSDEDVNHVMTKLSQYLC